jgi:gamma-glutamyl:cysteine ligase YbdK (ATP-grasp superfamily)
MSTALASPLRLFTGYGVELEYMIVAADTLVVRPLADVVLRDAHGRIAGDVAWGDIGLSNELCAHVLELKTNGPAPGLHGLAPRFQQAVTRADAMLGAHGARLLPTGMHPFMDPAREMVLWPHECNDVYRAFDRIFDCRGHGWSNLQSCHLNLPFGDDDEFARLHAAVRLVLPLLPALTASSPFVAGRRAPAVDQRLFVYRGNSARVPEAAGAVVPDNAHSQAEYQRDVIAPIWHAMAPLDPQGLLRHEWINARGAVARFDRMAIEIRILDCQEHPGADVALLAAISGLVRALVVERAPGTSVRAQRAVPTRELASVLWCTAKHGGAARIDAPRLLTALGLSPRVRTAGELWRELLPRALPSQADLAAFAPTLKLVLTAGTLGERIARAAGEHPTHHALCAVYRRLADCLATGRAFVP